MNENVNIELVLYIAALVAVAATVIYICIHSWKDIQEIKDEFVELIQDDVEYKAPFEIIKEKISEDDDNNGNKEGETEEP